MWKLLALAWVAAAQESATPPAPPLPNPRLEGFVMSQSGAALSKAALRLRGAVRNYSGESGSSGNFAFENVEPGDYTLTVDRTGYVRGVYNTSPSNLRGLFSLRAGQVKSDIVVKLIPQGV